ncbi:hypothetical protein Pogu_2356 [Pyrobaculum oguniense TE7]|uniref:Uncharacterized protein n=1 Tax=Pyrobaculum oguniense (strain DSM 13380 / JCM 10595 / TE7) TaxID=698757 RepID=H6QBN2_PYROT|nr:hypothetical protein Pogu_2356 [Pyrobaculum oguniense TE7]
MSSPYKRGPRGQIILLTALVLALAVSIVIVAQISTRMGQFASTYQTGYGIYAKAWPEAVDLADSHALQASLKGASQITTGALSAGLYSYWPYAARWHTYNATYAYLNKSLTAVKESFLPLGAQLDFGATVSYYGFNGSLGPYPLAAPLTSYNLNPVRLGYLTIPGGTLYRLVVYWQAQDYNGYFVATYSAHVSEPGAVGETYNVALAELLQAFNRSGYNLKKRLFFFLVHYDSGGCKIWQLPWWAEIKKCPLCLLHVRLPNVTEIGMDPPILRRGAVSEILVLLLPADLQGDQLALWLSGPCSQGGGLTTQQITVNIDANDNPYAVFAQTVQYDGPTPVSWSNPLYWSAADIRDWQSDIVSDNCRPKSRYKVTGGVRGWGVDLVYDGGFGQVAEVWAEYYAGTKNWAYNLYIPTPVSISGWPGFRTEALVRPMSLNTIRPARFDLYYYSSDPGSTHPICANFVAVQAVSPVLVWTNWRGWRDENSGVWNGRTWDDAGSVYFDSSWYLFTIYGSSDSIIYQIYSYNSTRALKAIATKRVQDTPRGVTSWQFYIVLGSAIVDNATSTTASWVERARYAYVRLRPWVDPPPGVTFTTLDAPPLVRPSRVDVVANRFANASSRVGLSGLIGLAGVYDLRIVRSVSLNASISLAAPPVVGPNQNTFTYWVEVSSSIPRGALAASFTLFYSLGSTYVNASCSSALCSATLVRYLGFDGSRDRAVYQVRVTVPAWVSHSIIVNVFGTKVALSPTAPRLYVVGAGGRSWYIINEGDGTAIFIFPWSGDATPVYSYSPDDPRYVGVNHVTDGSKRWTVVLVPPGTVVNITFAAPADASYLRDALVPWQRAYWAGQVSPPCPDPRFVRVYMPGNATLRRYFVMIPRDLGLQRNSRPSPPIAHAFIGGGWRQIPTYRDEAGMLWLRLDVQSFSPNQLTGRAVLVALCGSPNSNPRPESFFGFYKSWSPNSPEYPPLPPLDNYPDGYTVVVWLGRQRAVALFNISDYATPPVYSCNDKRKIIGMHYKDFPYYRYIWDYNGFCFDNHIWEQVGTDTSSATYVYMISVSQSTVLYQIFPGPGAAQWLRSYPNRAPALRDPVLGDRPMLYFSHIYANDAFSFTVVPFTWPRPYFYLDFDRRDPGPYETT